MITRRELIIAIMIAISLCGAVAQAQQEKRLRRIGYLSGSSAKGNTAWLAAFREGMAELRWVEGRDYVIDAHYGNGVAQALEGLATKLVAAQPDLVLTSADTVTRLLAQRTRTIPIVFATNQDPVGNGIAASLQRPGGNATGLTTMARDLVAKRLQLIQEAFPRVAHVVMMFEPAVVGIHLQVKETEEAAARLGMRITPIELWQAADIELAFKRGAALRAQAYMVPMGLLVANQRRAIAERSLRTEVPVIFADFQFVEAGGLMSYAPSQSDNFRRAAAYVDKILAKGAKPGDLPVEQPTKFELVVNLKTAKAMGFTFPQSILVRADRVIE